MSPADMLNTEVSWEENSSVYKPIQAPTLTDSYETAEEEVNMQKILHLTLLRQAEETRRIKNGHSSFLITSLRYFFFFFCNKFIINSTNDCNATYMETV